MSSIKTRAAGIPQLPYYYSGKSDLDRISHEFPFFGGTETAATEEKKKVPATAKDDDDISTYARATFNGGKKEEDRKFIQEERKFSPLSFFKVKE